MRRAQYLTEVPLLLCISCASALAFANVFSAAAPNDPRDCVSYNAGGTARLDMNCEGFGGRIPLNLTIPAGLELELEVGIDRELAGKHCRNSDPHDRVRATLSIRSVCDECFFTTVYFVPRRGKQVVWYLDYEGLDLFAAQLKGDMDSVTFIVNGSRIAMALPDKTYHKYKIGCRMDACLERESQKTYQLSFETADTACGFYVKFPTSVVLFPSAYTSTVYHLLQTSTTDNGATNQESTSAASLSATASTNKRFIDGSTVEITQPSVDIELSLPADEPLTFKMSFPHNTQKQLEDCMFGFHLFSLNPEGIQTWTSGLLESNLEISSERCTLSASFKGVLRQGTFVFEGARLQGEPWVYWHPLVSIRERTATLSDETNTQTTRLPCALTFEKDPATNRQRVVLRLKADFGFCNAKLTFPNTTQLLGPVAVAPTAVPTPRPTKTALEPSSSESTSAATLYTTPTATKQFVDGRSVQIVQQNIDVELSIPVDEPLAFKMSFPDTEQAKVCTSGFPQSRTDAAKRIEPKLRITSGRCTLSARFSRFGGPYPHGTFVFEDARLQRLHTPDSSFSWHPLVTISDRSATLSDKWNAQTTRLPCELVFQKDLKANRKRVVLKLRADVGLCSAKLIFPDTVLLLRPVAFTAVAVRQPTTTVLDPSSSERTAEESTLGAASNASPTPTKQFIDGITVEIVQQNVEIALSLPADEPLSFKLSFSSDFINCDTSRFSRRGPGLGSPGFKWDDMQTVLSSARIELKSGNCTLSAIYRKYPFEFDLEDAHLTQDDGFFGRQPLVVIEGKNATLSYESIKRSTTLQCEIAFEKEPSNRKSVVLKLNADMGFCKVKLIFPDTVQMLRPAEISPTAKVQWPRRNENGGCEKKCPYPPRRKRESEQSSATTPNAYYKSLMALSMQIVIVFLLNS